MFLAIEEGQKVVAHLLCTRLPNSTKMIDYLVSTTKDLEKYKSSVSYKPVVLPVMQVKKVEKKVGKHEPNLNPKHQKKNIFPPKEKENVKSHIAPPPPPAHKKRDEEGGFSPYENVPKQQPAERSMPVKKNLNTPPPPPVKEKKITTQLSQ